MKISGFGSITSTNSTSKRRGISANGNFADLLAASGDAEASGVNVTQDTAATSALSNLLALQEIPEADVQRKKLVQRGNNLLDTLEQLRRRLLSGSLSVELLKDMGRQLASEKQAVIDPGLNAIIEDIELRAAVELAKLEQAIAKDS